MDNLRSLIANVHSLSMGPGKMFASQQTRNDSLISEFSPAKNSHSIDSAEMEAGDRKAIGIAL